MANNKKQTNTPVVETPVKEGVTDTPVVDKAVGENLTTTQLLEMSGNPIPEDTRTQEQKDQEKADADEAVAVNLKAKVDKEAVDEFVELLNGDKVLGDDASDYKLSDYITDSGRTAAPARSLSTALQLITNDPNVVVSKHKLGLMLINIMEVANSADIHKRAVFYGDPKVQSRMSKQQGVIESLRERVNHGDLDFTDERSLNILHAIWGVQSELGEIAEELILSKAEKRQLNVENMKEEGGDIMWYLAMFFREIGTYFETVAEANINKLKARYPDQFDASKALNRDLDKEKDALNS